MSEPYIGQIDMFAGNFAPRGFAFCNGRLLGISQNQSLFSLLGTNYGGDGRTTCGLPNLQSRLPLDVGHGPGLSNYALGQVGGYSNVTLTSVSIPGHNHTLSATQTLADSATIQTSKLPGQPTDGSPPAFYGVQDTSKTTLPPHPMAPAACGQVGGNQAHSNLMPSLCITFIIALQGIFPSRN